MASPMLRGTSTTPVRDRFIGLDHDLAFHAVKTDLHPLAGLHSQAFRGFRVEHREGLADPLLNRSDAVRTVIPRSYRLVTGTASKLILLGPERGRFFRPPAGSVFSPRSAAVVSWTPSPCLFS